MIGVIFTIYSSLICLSYAEIDPLPFDETGQFSETIQLSTLTPITQDTTIMTRSIDEEESLFNVTLLLDDGTGDDYCFQRSCLNPAITIKAEHIDLDGSNEYLDIYFDSYVNESFIGQCGDQSGADSCWVFSDCIQGYQPPAGCYNALNFFIYQSASVDTLCSTSSEGEPERSLRLKFIVTCDAAGQCEESECGEGQVTRRRLSGDLLRDESVRETATYDLELECKAYEDAFTGFLVFVGICWIVQCGGFYVYKIKKYDTSNSNRNYNV